jgi:carbon monoxide dehydrogenase subunit G
MITIDKSCEIPSNADRVWDIVSDTDKDETYWTALRDVKVLRKEGNTIEREANVGPRAFAHKSRQTLVLDPKKSIKLTMAGATMAGERNLVLVPLGKTNTRIDVSWRFEVKDAPGFVQVLVKRQISKATEEALDRIKEETERILLAPKGRVA